MRLGRLGARQALEDTGEAAGALRFGRLAGIFRRSHGLVGLSSRLAQRHYATKHISEVLRGGGISGGSRTVKEMALERWEKGEVSLEGDNCLGCALIKPSGKYHEAQRPKGWPENNHRPARGSMAGDAAASRPRESGSRRPGTRRKPDSNGGVRHDSPANWLLHKGTTKGQRTGPSRRPLM